MTVLFQAHTGSLK